MTRERYNLFLELKRELDVEITELKEFLNIYECCNAIDFNEATVELQGWRELARGGGIELESGSIPTGFLIDDEKKESYAAQYSYWQWTTDNNAKKAQAKIDTDTEIRRQEFEKLKKEFDDPIK